jgi:hypothetical protein
VLVIHWAGGRGADSPTEAGRASPPDRPDAEGVVRRMAGAWPDHEIAACLNRLRLRTGAGNTWTASRVLSLRKRLHLMDYDRSVAKSMLTQRDSNARGPREKTGLEPSPGFGLPTVGFR